MKRLYNSLTWLFLLMLSVGLVSCTRNLSLFESANCYIVSQSGTYKFETVKGNSSVSVGDVSSCEVLWESFGTDVTPRVGDLIKEVSYNNDYITFQTADKFREGNAVIAARDAAGKILWSWHIWLTDQPQEQEYYNDAGTMMDRNLGATSANVGDRAARGLLFQWGRKDPFLGYISSRFDEMAKSNGVPFSVVFSNFSTGTNAYAVSHPTTKIEGNHINGNWYYTNSASTDSTLWTTSNHMKSIYDPCPPGWRVPDGGEDGVWAKAIGSSSTFRYIYDDINEGMNFSGRFGEISSIWYPLSSLYWSSSPYKAFYFGRDGEVSPLYTSGCASSYSIRCAKE